MRRETDIKFMDLGEFVDEGFLQEANRKFFHPLGLALGLQFDENDEPTRKAVIWDYRGDPEGMFFGEGVATIEKMHNVEELKQRKLSYRLKTGLCSSDGVQRLWD